ncbi:MAG: cation transporter [Gammaproteobacteria bacterium]|nr:cation transporter [Gammaproteobacteria bacterium]
MKSAPLPTVPAGAAQRHRAIRRVLFIEGISDVFFLVVKVVVGLQTGSSAVLSDAVHSLTDLANNIVGLALLGAANAPPDREHPYGHRKYETLAVFTIAVVIAAMAVQVVVRAVTRVQAEVTRDNVSLALMLIVLVVNVAFTVWERRQAERLDSDLLRADAGHTLSDVAVTIAVISGWQLAATGHPWIDTLAAIGVAAFVAWLAYSLFRRSIPVLVDSMVIDPQELSEIVQPVSGVAGVSRVRSHQAGSEKVIDIVVTVDGRLTTAESHVIADAVEAAVRQRIEGAQVNVHVEPAEAQKPPST